MIKLRLGELLKDREKSIYWLVKETGVSYPTLHRMATQEVKKVDLEILDKICGALGCELEELLTRDQAKE